ncbi:MAG: oxidoreductase [Alcanivorax sp.]|uniref:SDR family oxidoreductase n=1 Tax=Alloalcanivorax marinus TaxID=1177169 RepID=A0A9Q3UQN4_9GAMM|nr:oxidoreductase [Alloalcanivorax marinus]MCC4309754.1 SDR family oxidoreductase [Alloalcanivorax marinus]
MSWKPSDIPDQSGRVAVITGANSGIGLRAAHHLAARGARVIMACRNLEKAEAARRGLPGHTEIVHLDLASQASVRAAAEEIAGRCEHIDLLINNAGIMWLQEGRTEDGFERQFGINHLGHFAFTGHLLPRLRQVSGSRIVTVSSIAHRGGRIHFDNIHLDGEYGRQKAYAQAKLANLMFAIELERRLRDAGAETRSLACHPGVASTNLAGPGIAEESPLGIGRLARWAWPLFTQSAEKGSWPTLYAATSPDARGGHYYGPARLMEAFGPPTEARPRRYALDGARGARLWELSETLTGVRFP